MRELSALSDDISQERRAENEPDRKIPLPISSNAITYLPLFIGGGPKDWRNMRSVGSHVTGPINTIRWQCALARRTRQKGKAQE